MSKGRTIFSVVMLIFWICMAAYWTWSLVQKQELAAEDALYGEYGCLISADGKEYVCPNGLPPGKEEDK